MRYQGLIGMVAAAGFAITANGWAIELGSIADSRFQDEPGWTLDGNEMTDTRAKLMNQANFGPGGTVDEAINISDLTGEITYTRLSNFDIFFIGYFQDDDDNRFSEDELVAMGDWVTAGGTMIVTCDSPEQDTVCRVFGPMPSANNASPAVNPTGVGATRPIFDGPFGTPTELQMAGLRRYFEDTGGFSVLAEDQDGNPVVLEALIGDGRVVAFTDVDMISNDTLSDGSGISNDNDRFLGNLVAYLAGEAGETFVLNPGLNANWWVGPSRSGEGAQVEIIRTGEVLTAVVTFYSYNTENEQIFLIAIGTVNGNSANLDVFITDGGLWGDEFDPGLVDEIPFGSGAITSGHCGELTLAVTPNATYLDLGFSAQEWEMIRLAQTPAIPCPLDPVSQ